MFVIQDSATGLYSSGGYYPSWSKEGGKTYRTLAEVRSFLSLYQRGEPVRGLRWKTNKAREAEARSRRRHIPSTWVVVEMVTTVVGRRPATQLAKQPPESV